MEKDAKDTIEDRIVAVFHAPLSEILCDRFGKVRLISTSIAAGYLTLRNESKNAAKTVHTLNGEFCSLAVYEILRDSVFQYFSNILSVVKRIDVLWYLSLYSFYLQIDNYN